MDKRHDTNDPVLKRIAVLEDIVKLQDAAIRALADLVKDDWAYNKAREVDRQGLITW